MIINTIEIEGFRSIKNLFFDFSSSGVWSIQGENGAGKSTIFEALYYSLYGETVKDTVVADIPTLKKYRDSEFKGTSIKVWFTLNSNEYLIHRTIDYGTQRLSDTVIKKNGEIIPTSSRADAQQIINSIVGVTPALFKNSVFFAQKSLRLVDAKDAEKRDIFDELFNVSLDLYLDRAKTKVSEIDLEYNTCLGRINATQSMLANFKQQLASDRISRDTFEDGKKQRISIVETDIKTIENKISETNLAEVIMEPVEPADASEQHSLSLRKHGAENKINALRAKEASLRLPSDTCNVCGGPIKAEKLKELQDSYNKEKEVIQSEIQTAEKELNAAILEYGIAKEEYDKASLKYSEYSKIMIEQNAVVNFLNVQKQKLEGEKKLLASLLSQECPITEASLNNLEVHIDSQTKNLASEQAKAIDLAANLNSYKYWATEGFTSKGLQAHIINAMLVGLNKSLTEYGEKLGILVCLDMKMDTKSKAFTIKITDLNGTEKSYQSLSGGERKRVDIIVSFALHDILNKQVSLMVVDELFEGLDEQGQDIAMNLIRLKAEKQAVYVITHNLNTDLTGARIISVKKEGNFTIIKK